MGECCRAGGGREKGLRCDRHLSYVIQLWSVLPQMTGSNTLGAQHFLNQYFVFVEKINNIGLFPGILLNYLLFLVFIEFFK